MQQVEWKTFEQSAVTIEADMSFVDILRFLLVNRLGVNVNSFAEIKTSAFNPTIKNSAVTDLDKWNRESMAYNTMNDNVQVQFSITIEDMYRIIKTDNNELLTQNLKQVFQVLFPFLGSLLNRKL